MPFSLQKLRILSLKTQLLQDRRREEGEKISYNSNRHPKLRQNFKFSCHFQLISFISIFLPTLSLLIKLGIRYLSDYFFKVDLPLSGCTLHKNQCHVHFGHHYIPMTDTGPAQDRCSMNVLKIEQIGYKEVYFDTKLFSMQNDGIKASLHPR